MANIACSTPGADGQQLTKPADWALHMVTAALKFSSDTPSSTAYTTPDEGCLDVLNTLNWYEAHDEYAWPDFSSMGFDFSQAMRFRRALVNDVFIALQKAGSIKIGGGAGVLGTPESAVATKGAKRGGMAGDRRMAERKRLCKQEDESDTDDDPEKAFWADKETLAEAVGKMIRISEFDVIDYLDRGHDADRLAKMLHAYIVDWGR